MTRKFGICLSSHLKENQFNLKQENYKKWALFIEAPEHFFC